MIITKKHLSRRTFLQGTFGAAMALPLLDAMVPAAAAFDNRLPDRSNHTSSAPGSASR